MNKEFEKLEPLFIDRSVVNKEFTPIYRTFSGGSRYYYAIDKSGVRSYPSVTSILSATMPTSPWLINWIADYGKQRADELKNQAADYGTLMHILISQFIKNKSFNFDFLKIQIDQYKAEHRITYNTSKWRENLEWDLTAFGTFVAEYNVKPIAISIMLMNDKKQYAGELDFVCSMDTGSGKTGKILANGIRNRVTAIIDFKSGRHGFYASSEAQLYFYKELWEENCPELKIDRVFNWAPSERTDKPAYQLKDQTGSNEQFKIDSYLQIFKIEEAKKKERTFFRAEGTMIYGEKPECYVIESFEERAVRIHGGISLSEKQVETVAKAVVSAAITANEVMREAQKATPFEPTPVKAPAPESEDEFILSDAEVQKVIDDARAKSTYEESLAKALPGAKPIIKPSELVKESPAQGFAKRRMQAEKIEEPQEEKTLTPEEVLEQLDRELF